jgi:hypothetical protein
MKTTTLEESDAERIPVSTPASYFIIPEPLNDRCCTSPNQLFGLALITNHVYR